jgi:hypothetical protein
LRNCGVAVAEQHFLKSCETAIEDVRPSSFGIAIAESKKVAHAHLWLLVIFKFPVAPHIWALIPGIKII